MDTSTIVPSASHAHCTTQRSTLPQGARCRVQRANNSVSKKIEARVMRKTVIRTPGYEPEQVWLPASEQLMEWGESFHDLLLGDELRMTAFRAAIDEVVWPGSTVLDLGTGTGILAEWALR